MRLDKFQIKIIENWCKSNGFEVKDYGGLLDIFYLNNVSDEYDNAVAKNLMTWGDWLRFKKWVLLDKESQEMVGLNYLKLQALHEGGFGEFETYNP